MRFDRPARAGLRPIFSRIAVLAFASTTLIATVPRPAVGAPAADPGVITQWNEVAVATIVVDAGKANAEALLWYSFAQLAVYNAVVGITRTYELYEWDDLGPVGASPQAAAAAAAHRLLKTYFPASATRLDTAFAASLADIPAGSARRQGVRYGRQAANHIVEIRDDDGRFGPVTFDEAPAPGVWRPTPPTMTPFFDPWLAKVEPLTLESPDQFRPRPPPPLGSDRYAREFNEVKRLGSKTSSARTPEQTQIALFFSDIGIGPFQASLRDLVTRHEMDISESARLFAAVDTSIADTLIATWDAKLEYAFWRPITAIPLAGQDGNDDTKRDLDWEPLVVTPPYPEHPSGLTGAIGALTRALTEVLGSYRIDLNVTSIAGGLPGSPLTRHYEFAGQLTRNAVEARVWSGIHFRTADTAGVTLGRRVASWALDHHFQPTEE